MKEWIIGRNPVYEVLQAGRRHVFSLRISRNAEEKGRLAEIVTLCAGWKVPVQRVPRAQLDSFGSNHQG
ncbi:MAG: 23S rRNA (guanosine(2251)-2'-O)-methyltransferase RlmB, partial [Anaerolineales bacterium]|nr:23S rRNA (guanosine(2251)-2'-O)-methyltransferase RlmB [Anaerolineales bacterium]